MGYHSSLSTLRLLDTQRRDRNCWYMVTSAGTPCNGFQYVKRQHCKVTCGRAILQLPVVMGAKASKGSVHDEYAIGGLLGEGSFG